MKIMKKYIVLSLTLLTVSLSNAQENIDDLLKLKEMFESIKTYVDNKVKEGVKTIDDMTDNVKAIDDRFKSFSKLIDNKNENINFIKCAKICEFFFCTLKKSSV